MKFKKSILGLFLLTPSIIFAAHLSQRKLFATDMVNKVGTQTFLFPATLPDANRAPLFNADREITSSNVTSTELNYLSGVTSPIQNQINSLAAAGAGGTTFVTIPSSQFPKTLTSAEVIANGFYFLNPNDDNTLTLPAVDTSFANKEVTFVKGNTGSVYIFNVVGGPSNRLNSSYEAVHLRADINLGWVAVATKDHNGSFYSYSYSGEIANEPGSIALLNIGSTVDKPFQFPDPANVANKGSMFTMAITDVGTTGNALITATNGRYFHTKLGEILSFRLKGLGSYVTVRSNGAYYQIIGGSPEVFGVYGIPAGGTSGQVLTKNSSSDFDASWATASGGGGGGVSPPVELDAVGALPNMIHFTHSSRAGTGPTDGVVMGYPNGQDNFEIKNQYTDDGNERLIFSLAGGQQLILDPRAMFTSGGTFMPLSGLSFPSGVGAYGSSYVMDGVNDTVLNYLDLTSSNNTTTLPSSNINFFTKPVYYFGKADSSTHVLTVQAKSGEYLNGVLNGSIVVSTQYEWVMISALTSTNGWAVTSRSIPESGPAQPACSVNTRGHSWTIQGASGVADTFQVCTKDASNAYSWVTK